MSKTKGGFTLPGESGYERLTLELAEKWGADVIRDSDGTTLSDEIINAGYGIYSTICIIRDHNEWARKNPDKLQQTFLMTEPRVAEGESLKIDLMKDFFEEQFKINETKDSLKYWQVFDRTENCEVKDWAYENGCVTFTATPWHKYTVNFLAYRIWEEISMYNHTTNNWDKEHLMQIDPIYPETMEYMTSWMKEWCESHPMTTVVRFTSMFYNFVWIWGSNERRRNIFSDWASYDFTVSPRALDLFGEKYGYYLTSEDFVNKGKMHATHCVCDQKKLDWMEFVNDFVIKAGKELVDIVHAYGKKAYVFYDDSWVGVEPWGERFAEFGFDGLIKCVFSGFEVRLCSGVKGVQTHEIRLHPYLFPVGLGGLPTFSEGGNPTLDAKLYWRNVRRALLRANIDRIGLGGYLSLTLPFPEFNDYMERLSDEFRMIRDFHANGGPLSLKPRIAVLTFWGRFRSWTCSGHLHEHSEVDLINIIESLSGFPFEVEFINFNDIKNGKLDDFDLLINAGVQDSAWSGGYEWRDNAVIEKVTQWAHKGGCVIGVNEPGATDGFDTTLRLSHILGVDLDRGERICHGRWLNEAKGSDLEVLCNKAAYITDADTVVLKDEDGVPTLTMHPFGKGMGIYMGGYRHSEENAGVLLRLILSLTESNGQYITDNVNTECAYYPNDKKLVVINNSGVEQKTSVETENGKHSVTLAPYDIAVIQL
ncbi:MAG: 1,3-beta-galactosyl-N-acetylhexosamine phosphorylase [Clostridia bacterium]|nr:1,3-beta-galactosyl-N-acetylhexosamine phosphorylase [Clostridia bacterium]